MASDARTYPMMVYLSGPFRGRSVTLSGGTARIGRGSDVEVALSGEPTGAGLAGTLSRDEGRFVLEAAPGAEIFVNGRPIAREALESGDVVEIGGSDLLRFRVIPEARAARRTTREVLGDCIACARHGADTWPGRAWLLMRGMAEEIAREPHHLGRFAVVAALVALAVSTWTLAGRASRLEQRLAAETTRVEGLAELLDRTGSEDMGAEDLDRLLAELQAGVASATERLEGIQDRLGAAGRIVREAAGATALLQAAYGFRDPETGRLMRLELGPGGRPLGRLGGEPRLTPHGNGPVVEISYTGTGFLVSDDGLLLTNRHVALPWEFDETARRLVARGLEPVMHRFIGYLPELKEPFDLRPIASSARADLSVLQCDCGFDRPFLEISDRPPTAADEVIVLGYPLGIRALTARTSPEFVAEIQGEGGGNFWELARRLSEEGYIAPLATRGIVGQLTQRFIVYDAETTSGGSGGPVLALDGRVVAVNAAILPEFGGSNLGVPAREVRALLDEARGGPRERRPVDSIEVTR